MMMVKAFAKINVALNINEKLDNGYHSIDTIILPLQLHDRIEIEELQNGFDTMITCDDVSLPTDESNLVVKTVNILREHFKFKNNFRIHVHKCIPISAGLAGGSADAAATMNTIIKMLHIKTTKEEMIEVAKRIGSDVPYCLFNKPSRCKGMGEELTEIQVKNKYYVLLIKPKKGIVTAEAYKKYDEIKDKEYSDIDNLILALKNGDEKIIANEMKNGLEKPAIEMVEDIKIIKNQLIKDGFNMTLMSGSGSTVFALSSSFKDLQKESCKFDSKKYYVKLTSIN